MEIGQTIEERKSTVMEYLAQIYFDLGTIASNQLLPMAIYLYRNADLGPRGTKKVAKYLLKLSDIAKIYAIDYLSAGYDRKEIKSICQRIKNCLDCKKINHYVLEKAKKTLESADKTATSGNYICNDYDSFFKILTELRLDLEQQDYGMIYIETWGLLALLEQNEKKKETIIRDAREAKERLKELWNLSKNPKEIVLLSEMIFELDYASKEMQYREMQEKIAGANAVITYVAKSEGYQKQISKGTENIVRHGNDL